MTATTKLSYVLKATHKNGLSEEWQEAGHLSQSITGGGKKKTGTTAIFSVIGIETITKAVSDDTAASGGQS